MRYFLCYNKSVNAATRERGAGRQVGAMLAAVLLLLLVAARPAKAAQRVTLSFKNAKIEQVFSEISKQTDYRFFYSDEVARKAVPVSITVTDVDVLELLNELMHGQAMQYKVIAGTIIVNVLGGPGNMRPTPVVSRQIMVTNMRAIHGRSDKLSPI